MVNKLLDMAAHLIIISFLLAMVIAVIWILTTIITFKIFFIAFIGTCLVVWATCRIYIKPGDKK